MQSMMHLPFPKLKDEETIAAQNNFLINIGTRNKKLTKKQTKNLNKFAKRITTSTKAEQN